MREQLVDMPLCYCSAELVVSGVGVESPQHCQCAHNTTVAHLSVRDIRLVPHVLHGSAGILIVLLSPDTNVFCTGTLLLEYV